MNSRVVLAYFIVESLFYAIALHDDANKENSLKLFSNQTDLSSFQNSESGFGQRKWISQLFHDAQMAFQMSPNVNSECKKDFDLYMLHLKNQSTWAVKMMESSEWPVRGILSGTVDFMGNYDECLAISSYGINGRYCLTDATYDYSDILQSRYVDSPDGTISAWDVAIMYEKNPTRINRKKLTFAMCIPSSCKSNDLQISLDRSLSKIFKPHRVNISINVEPISCQTRNEFVYPIGFYVASLFFIALFLLVIWSTWYDIATSDALVGVEKNGEQKNNSITEVSKIFSLTRNFRKFATINAKELAVLQYPKILNMLVILCSHRLALSIIGNPTSNSMEIEQLYRGPLSLALGRQQVVDVFFFISGFLTFYVELGPMIKGGKIYLYSNFVLKWIRFIPVLGVLTLYVVYILPYTGDGPRWNRRIMQEADYCKETWWAGLLGLTNIVKVEQQCLVHTWYIAANFQLVSIGSILLYIYSKNEKTGIVATVLLFAICIVMTFWTAYVHQVNGVLKIFRETVSNLRSSKDFIHSYVTLYSRCGPYLLGFFTAYIVKLLKERNFKFTNKQTYVLLLVFALLSEVGQIYGSLFFAFNRPSFRLENALYNCTIRIIFVSFYTVFYAAYFTSGLGIFNKIVEWKVWILWARLSYSVYLVSIVVQMYYDAAQRDPISFTGQMNMVWWNLGDIVVSHVIGLIFHLFVEAPILNLRILIKKLILRYFGNSEQVVKDVKNEVKPVEINSKKNT